MSEPSPTNLGKCKSRACPLIDPFHEHPSGTEWIPSFVKGARVERGRTKVHPTRAMLRWCVGRNGIPSPRWIARSVARWSVSTWRSPAGAAAAPCEKKVCKVDRALRRAMVVRKRDQPTRPHSRSLVGKHLFQGNDEIGQERGRQ
jgi:hypothetical protein